MTHAWLIIAHEEFGILQRLVSALDAPECDIFIHFDRKVPVLPEIKAERSRMTFLQDRVDVRWGSVSQIRCEFALLEAATGRGPYDFYHIISGTTLPLKPLGQIDARLAENRGKNILSGLSKDLPYQETLKVRRYNLFLRDYASRNAFRKHASQFLWKSAIAVQRALGIETNRGKVFYKASNWASLSDSAVHYLLSRKEGILKTYRFSFCGDEYFVPSELMDSPLKDTLVNDGRYLLHSIARSNAATYRLDEYRELCGSGYLFARKFTEK